MANAGFKELYTIKTEGYVRPKEDFFETPPEATRALLAHIDINPNYVIWESSCGKGAISKVLRENLKNEILETDLVDRGVGIGNVDFFHAEDYVPKKPFIILTNPAYNIADNYVRQAFKYGADVIILLLRHAYTESSKTREDILSGGHLMKELLIKERLKMSPDGWEGKKQSSMYNHGWFIWSRHYNAVNPNEFTVERISIKDGEKLNGKSNY